MAQNRTPEAPTFSAEQVARMKAAILNETRTYTDPRADYPLARVARDAQTAGAARRPR